MTLVVCLDKRDGMGFNNRRQSADRCVTERVARMSADSGDIYFFENGDISAYLEIVNKVVIFRWDKVYPADIRFPMDRFSKEFRLSSTETFPGYSHDLITQEVYER